MQRGGLQCTLHFRGPQKFGGEMSDIFCTPSQRARRGILMPRGKSCRETIFARQLPRNCPHHGGNLERGKNVLYCGGEAIWEAFYETIWAREIESQKLPRDSGESIFAARHQDVSQGPLGCFTVFDVQDVRNTISDNFRILPKCFRKSQRTLRY